MLLCSNLIEESPILDSFNIQTVDNIKQDQKSNRMRSGDAFLIILIQMYI